jgi:hypothetical protein
MFQKRLPAILSSFTKTLSQLEALQESNKAAVETNDWKISTLIAESHDLSAETEQAKKVAANLRTILGE